MPDIPAETAIEAIAHRWSGRFDNRRQVDANRARRGVVAPELTRERRRLEVHRLEAPQIGATVLYFQEFREGTPGLAHRQRVTALVVDEDTDQVRAQQWFFRDGPTYDRPPLEPATVARLGPEDFVRHPGCDLWFSHEPELDRYRGVMRPGRCTYRHPGDGEVTAEFAMLLHRDELWYRDRSLRLADGTVRGEIDGFSWLLFDRIDAASLQPALLRQLGVWEGLWRRFDATGEQIAEIPTTIVARLLEVDGRLQYHQTNLYRPAGAAPERVESFGTVEPGRIRFANERLQGEAVDLPGDGGGDTGGSLIRLRFQRPPGLSAEEIVSLSPDGERRWRASQILQDGVLVQRTLIDEKRVSRDWHVWDADHPG